MTIAVVSRDFIMTDNLGMNNTHPYLVQKLHFTPSYIFTIVGNVLDGERAIGEFINCKRASVRLSDTNSSVFFMDRESGEVHMLQDDPIPGQKKRGHTVIMTGGCMFFGDGWDSLLNVIKLIRAEILGVDAGVEALKCIWLNDSRRQLADELVFSVVARDSNSQIVTLTPAQALRFLLEYEDSDHVFPRFVHHRPSEDDKRALDAIARPFNIKALMLDPQE